MEKKQHKSRIFLSTVDVHFTLSHPLSDNKLVDCLHFSPRSPVFLLCRMCRHIVQYSFRVKPQELNLQRATSVYEVVEHLIITTISYQSLFESNRKRMQHKCKSVFSDSVWRTSLLWPLNLHKPSHSIVYPYSLFKCVGSTFCSTITYLWLDQGDGGGFTYLFFVLQTVYFTGLKND